MADETNDNNTPTLDANDALPVTPDAAVEAESQPAEEPQTDAAVQQVDQSADAAVESATDAGGDAPVEESAEAETAAEPENAAEPEKPVESEKAAEPEKPAESEKPAEPTKPEPLTAVSLGLIPEVFVSRVSTQLHFYAPEITPLPARPGRDRDNVRDSDQDETSGGRRGRRRRGGDGDDQQAEPRQRQRAVEYITEPKAIKGSTRLEAKKQRRRDGRDAGRRRPVVTEAEFLARRESVDRKMIVRSKNGRTQIGVLEDAVLVEHYVARNQDASLIGNVYLGRVQNVLPSMEAALDRKSVV